ncbi:MULTISPECIES: AAA family ATPase [unclassified Prochlorococcus]|uniref:AAA family ATPase n=1 Tax=unclassified Prochlorococcus TaxID=2627481 RepID=UPI00145CD252|nr:MULTISPECIES: AAA family ATPase [unclassified Prochlorococcus]NMO84304.1 AAA family ATPase [Prochlorococcus sp. P1344]NMP13022.1 AAA family ATPase [Prochlorococcus sp.P1363]
MNSFESSLSEFDGQDEPLHIGHQPEKTKLSEWEQRKAAALIGTDGDPVKIHDVLYGLLLDEASKVLKSNRPIRQQRSAIKAIAYSLDFKFSNADVAELYDSLDTSVAAYEPDVQPGGEFLALSQSWLLDELILNGLNLLVGMPGAGKSRFLVALIRAFLSDQPTFIGRSLLPGSDRHVLIVGTDQDRQQWGALLAEQGLATIVDRKVIDNQTHILYKLHPRIHLKTSGGGFRLDADGRRWIRDWNKDFHGGLNVLDSLSAVLPPGIKEGDESAGRLMRQLEVSRQGNCCIVTHHTNKQSAMAGELGVYSGSGSGTIDRAVSRFLGLGYETHKENGVEKLHEDSPRRILTSQKRGAGNQRLVLENGNRNTWDFIGTAAEVREMRREDELGAGTTPFNKGWKKDVWEATTDQWQSTTQVFDRLTPQRAKASNAKQQVRRTLRDIATDHDLIESQDSEDFQGEMLWRRKLSLT